MLFHPHDVESKVFLLIGLNVDLVEKYFLGCIIISQNC